MRQQLFLFYCVIIIKVIVLKNLHRQLKSLKTLQKLLKITLKLILQLWPPGGDMSPANCCNLSIFYFSFPNRFDPRKRVFLITCLIKVALARCTRLWYEWCYMKVQPSWSSSSDRSTPVKASIKPDKCTTLCFKLERLPSGGPACENCVFSTAMMLHQLLGALLVLGEDPERM